MLQGNLPLKMRTTTYSISRGYLEEMRQCILQSRLLIYECEGEEKEIKEWFRTINIVGIPLNEQELLNAIFSGEFVNAAKRSIQQFAECRDAKVGALY